MIFLFRRLEEDVRLAVVEGMKASVVREIDEEFEFSTTSRRFGYVRRSKIRREAERAASSLPRDHLHRRGRLRRKENARRYRFPFAVDEEMAPWDFLRCGEVETIVDRKSDE